MRDGIVAQLGEKHLILPKLSCGILQRHWPKFSELRRKIALEEGAEDLLFELAAIQNTIIWEAFKRNYPDMRLEEVEDELSPGESNELFARLMDFSRMKRGEKPATEVAPGEAKRP